MTSDSDRSPAIRTWALALGVTGFASGFLGPIALNPSANQGPLLGLFITGPIGALIGLAVGAAARHLPLTGRQRRRALATLCAATAVGILFFCLPAPEIRARILDAEVRGCALPGPLADAATKQWETRIASTSTPPRPSWKRDVARMLGADRGVVLDLTIVRERAIYEKRRPWNRGARFAGHWRDSGKSQRFFARWAGASCDNYATIGRNVFLPSSAVTGAWPPDQLPNYLGLELLDPVPAEYRDFATSE
jgi:hypothetical protein